MASVFDQVSKGVQKTASGAVDGARSVAATAVGEVKGVAGQLVGEASGVVAGAKSAFDTASSVVTGAYNMVANNPGGVIEGAKSLASAVGGAVAGSAEGLLSNVGGEIIGSMSSGGGIGGLLGGALGGIINNANARPWGKLNHHLFAQLWACDSRGAPFRSDSEEFQKFVMAPISDVNFELTANWQSPFENTGPESKAPALMAMLQSGQFGMVINALQTVLPDAAREAAGGLLDEAANKAVEASRALEGRTGITKLNSRQVFSGMPPLRITLTMHLRAIKDPEREIYEQYQRLLRWSLPQQLADDSTLTGIIKQSGDTASMVKAMFPSMAPLMVAMLYGGQSFRPMVIESLSNPLDSPRYRDGSYVYLPIQMTLATLTALDRDDVQGMFL